MEQDSEWQRPGTFEFITDNETMVDILSGTAEPESTDRDTLSQILRDISDLIVGRNWGPRESNGNPVKWRRRCFNKEADYLANQAMDARRGFSYCNQGLVDNLASVRNIQGWSDGGCRIHEGVSSYAWLLKAWTG
eukprot:12409097-Karenia_brevis.AAC.1